MSHCSSPTRFAHARRLAMAQALLPLAVKLLAALLVLGLLISRVQAG